MQAPVTTGGKAPSGAPHSPRAPPLRMLKTSTLKKSVRTIHKDFGAILLGSFCLCINAGFINVLTYTSYLAIASAHVTGLVAKTSMFIGLKDWKHLYLPPTMWFAFLVGASISGYLVSYESFYLGRIYGRVLLLITLVEGVALVLEHIHPTEHYFVYGCALVCGLQNGLTSKYSGNTVRTTHLTGATTDLGVTFGHLAKGKWEELWKVQLHGVAILGFLLGGIMAVPAFQHFQRIALGFNMALTGSLGLAHMIYVSYHENLTILEVARSNTDIKIHTESQAPPDETFGASMARLFSTSAASVHHTASTLHAPDTVRLRNVLAAKSIEEVDNEDEEVELPRKAGSSGATEVAAQVVVDDSLSDQEYEEAEHSVDGRDDYYSDNDVALQDEEGEGGDVPGMRSKLVEGGASTRGEDGKPQV